MEKCKSLILLVTITCLFSCEKENLIDQIVDFKDMPGQYIMEMEIDNNNIFYFATSERDTSVEVPNWASYIPLKAYLSKRETETGKFEILDDDFIFVDEMLFDKNNNLWARNTKTIYMKDGETYKEIIDLSDTVGLFMFMAVDNENNIWAGGLSTGLYKIDSNLDIKKFTPENSPLPRYSMTNIHIDKNNNIWLAVWNNQGVLKIEKDNWINYNSNNSNITSQNIWCLVTDKDNNLWIGTGHDDKQISLMRFDGEQWETINPRNNKNEIITGTVRKLFADENKIYVVSEEVKNMTFSSNELLTFDGVSWNKINDLPEDDGIADLIIDNFRQKVWIRTLNKGIFKIVK